MYFFYIFAQKHVLHYIKKLMSQYKKIYYLFNGNFVNKMHIRFPPDVVMSYYKNLSFEREL